MNREANSKEVLRIKDRCIGVVILHYDGKVSRDEIEGSLATVLGSIAPEDLSESLLQRMLAYLENYVPDEVQSIADARAKVGAAAHCLLTSLEELRKAEAAER